MNLHHTAAAEGVADVAGALATQFRGVSTAGPHPTLLLEARFDVHAFVARVMVDAVRLLPGGAGGAIAYTFSL